MRYGWHAQKGQRDELLERNFEVAKQVRRRNLAASAPCNAPEPRLAHSRCCYSVRQEFPWIMEHTHRSLTELEFIAGHFKCLGEKGASFYFRDSAYDERKHAALLAAGDRQGSVGPVQERARSVCACAPCSSYKTVFCSSTGAAKYTSESEYAAEMRDNVKRRVRWFGRGKRKRDTTVVFF